MALPILDATAVRIATTGAVFVDLTGTASAPTDAKGDPGTGWTGTGYLSEDGITFSEERDSTSIQAWQNGDTVRTTQSSFETTISFEFLESSPVVHELFYGNNTEAASLGTVEMTGAMRPTLPWLIDVIDGLHLVRYVIGAAQITEVGDQQYVSSDAIKFPVTLTVYRGSDGVFWTRYSEKITAE